MTSKRTRDRLVKRLADGGISDERVLEALTNTPRHIFVDEALSHRAYEDSALPIGHGQTISQPFIVALMTQALLVKEPQRVLEIGTGSGYQAAVLSAVVDRVYTVERILALLGHATDRFRALGLKNIRMKHDDGTVGWSEEAPFDAIMVTAATRALPEALLEQLSDGGRLVIPVGPAGAQELKVVERCGDGWQQETLDYVRFVPLLHGAER